MKRRLTAEQKQRRAEREHDEQILAAILSAPHVVTTDVDGAEVPIDVEPGPIFRDGSACAVGAALLYKGIGRDRVMRSAGAAFAEHYGVTFDYAAGVSDGFETDRNGRCVRDFDSSYDKDAAEYERGFAVGAAAARALGVESGL